MKQKVPERSTPSIYRISFLILVLLALTSVSGCGVRNANVIPGKPIAVHQFSGKSVSILPVHGDTSLGTDSQLQLKKDINEKIDAKFKELLPQSRIIGTNTVIQKLNRNRMLDIFDELSKPYKSVGVFDENIIASLFKLLKSDFIIISELDNENIDVVAANAYLLSLDILIVNRNNEIVWSGTGDFKQGGLFGIGRVSNEQGAEEIVNLAFAYWQPTYDSTPATVTPPPPPIREKVSKPAPRRGDPLLKSVQQELNDRGYKAGTADGFMGRKTREALKSYQDDYGLSATGRTDEETLVSLGLREAEPAPSTPEPAKSAISSQDDPQDLLTEPTPSSQESGKREEQSRPAASEQYVTTRRAELQSTDDLFSETLLKIPSGTLLKVLSVEDNWYKVLYKQKEGYVLAEFVEKK